MKKTATRKGVVPQGDSKKIPAAPPKQGADWDAIERVYRAGLLTVREIARQHGVSHVAVAKHAKSHGWSRDLTARVREAVTTGLVTTPLTSEELVTAKRTEREIVEAAATQVITLVREHRKDISVQRELAAKLLAQLNFTSDYREQLEELIHEETAEADGSPSTPAERGAKTQAIIKRGQMLRAVALPQNAATLKDLATVLKTLVALEREAFNISGAPEEPKSPEDGATRAAQLPQLTAALEKVAKVLGT